MGSVDNQRAELALCIVKGIKAVLNENDDFSDFRVIVDDTVIPCNSLVLSACSDYFKRLLSSGMKESRASEVKLPGVRKDTFCLIWTMMSGGEICIDEANVVDLLYASDRLLIPSLKTLCETFVLANLTTENCSKMYTHSKRLGIDKIEEGCRSFVRDNFSDFRDSCEFLSFEEFLEMVKSPDLCVQTEDHAIQAIFRWTENCGIVDLDSARGRSDLAGLTTDQPPETIPEVEGSSDETSPPETEAGQDTRAQRSETDQLQSSTCPSFTDLASTPTFGSRTQEFSDQELERHDTDNAESSGKLCRSEANEETVAPVDRSTRLADLLAASRLVFASPECLSDTFSKTIKLMDQEALKIVQRAVEHQICPDKMQVHPWFPWATHRRRSDMEHVMVFAKEQDERVVLDCFKFSTGTFEQLIVGEGQVELSYEDVDTILVSTNRHQVFVFVKYAHTNDSKVYTYSVQGRSWDFKTFEVDFCAMTSTNKMLYGVSPGGQVIAWTLGKQSIKCGSLQRREGIEHIIVFNEKLVAISGNGDSVTDVEVFCTTSGKSTIIESIDGPSNNLVTFGFEEDVFLLQNNGSLWRLRAKKESPFVEVEKLSKLWNVCWPLRGAVVFEGTLTILGVGRVEGFLSCPDGAKALGLGLKCVHLDASCMFKCMPMVVPKCLLNTTLNQGPLTSTGTGASLPCQQPVAPSGAVFGGFNLNPWRR